MSVLVSGATGFIGIQLVRRLSAGGITVHALYRSESKADSIRRIKGVKPCKGDILDRASLSLAMKGCDQVFHTAAFAGVWSKDPGLVYRLNVDGTLNVVHTAAALGVRRIVVTSTAGILGPSEGETVTEGSPPPDSFFTPYEESKQQMEQELLSRRDNAPEIVIVNPTRVYGPGIISDSNGVTRMIGLYMRGRWRFIPGDGNRIGNYVFVEDVVTGHLLAMEKGMPGERYVLGGENISYNQLFQNIADATGIRKRMYHIPLWMMITMASGIRLYSAATGRPPLITLGLVRKYNHNWIVSSEKARIELGYQPISTSEGIRRTVDWLLSKELFR